MINTIVNKAALFLLIGVFVAGCAKSGGGDYSSSSAINNISVETSSAERIEYEKMMIEAKAKQKRAAAVGGEWRDIEKFLQSADQAANKGDYIKAIQWAKKAKGQGERGYDQAQEEKNAGNPSYMQ